MSWSGDLGRQQSIILDLNCLCREVSRLWKNEDVSWQTVQVNEVASNGVVNAAAASQGLDEEEEEEEDFGQADMFADYKPSKCRDVVVVCLCDIVMFNAVCSEYWNQTS